MNKFDNYFKYYIDLVENPNLIEVLENEHEKTQHLIRTIPEEKEEYRYLAGKWTIKQLYNHLVDSERIFGYRALRFARNDKTSLLGYDHDQYTINDNSEGRGLKSIAEEYKIVREGTIALFKSFNSDMMRRQGIANELQLNVEAIGFICVGHEIHHNKVVVEKYLNK